MLDPELGRAEGVEVAVAGRGSPEDNIKNEKKHSTIFITVSQ